MAIRTVTDAIRYVGVDDTTLALFENQYPVQPMVRMILLRSRNTASYSSG